MKRNYSLKHQRKYLFSHKFYCRSPFTDELKNICRVERERKQTVKNLILIGTFENDSIKNQIFTIFYAFQLFVRSFILFTISAFEVLMIFIFICISIIKTYWKIDNADADNK